MMELKVSTLGHQTGENCGFSPLRILGGTRMNTSIGHNQFQNIPRRRVATFCKNRWKRLLVEKDLN